MFGSSCIWIASPVSKVRLWKKSCLKELKFCEVSENPKSSSAKNFSCLFHWEVRNPHPLYKLGRSWKSPFGTRGSSHRDGEVWLKSFNFKSLCALNFILFFSLSFHSACKQINLSLQDHILCFKLVHSGWDSATPVTLVSHTVCCSTCGKEAAIHYEQIWFKKFCQLELLVILKVA